jgi:ATP-binding cassette subfamily F protein 3
VVVVSHDRYFLDRVVTRVWNLDEGRLLTYPGNFSKYRVLKSERIVRQRKEYESQQEFIAKEELFIARYHSGQRAREARGRATRLGKLRRIEAPRREESVSLAKISASRTGEVVLRTRALEVGFGAGPRQVRLLAMADTELHRGSRTAVIGSNGVGKTTLLRTVLGLTPALQGEAGLGHNVRPGYLSQGEDMLPEDATVLEAFLGAKGATFGEARSYLARFLFTGEEVFQRVGSLSGGERARLRLARLMVTEPNFLVFDEPTTHLDIPSREALEQVLTAFDGTLLFVSHDRLLISIMAEQLWVAADGAVQVFDGGFDGWLESAPQSEAASTARARPRPRADHRGPSARSVRAAEAEKERAITDLETRLEAIERELEEASERQDVVEIARLGREHGDTQGNLERRLAEWGGRA